MGMNCKVNCKVNWKVNWNMNQLFKVRNTEE